MDLLDVKTTFTDKLNRSWTLVIDMTNDDRIQAITGASLVDLVPVSKSKKHGKEPGDFTALGEFISDPYLVFDAFYAAIKPTADALGLDRAGVKAGFDQETTAKMGLAMMRAIHDFFPLDPTRQAALRRIAQMIGPLATKMANKAMVELEKIDVNAIVDAMPTLDGATATSEVIARLKNSASTGVATSA